MSGFRNVSFDDRQTDLIKYDGPNGTASWFLNGNWNATAVQETGTLSSANKLGANLTFVFPVPATGFYYYGIPRCCGGFYAICIDCNPENPQFIPIDGVNGTDNGQNPPSLLFSIKFDKPGIHEIILQNLNDTRFGKSQITLDRFDLEVPVDQVPVGATTVLPGALASRSPTPSPKGGLSGSNTKTLVPIIVGCVAGILLIFALLLVWYIFRSRRRRMEAKELTPHTQESVVGLVSQPSVYNIGASSTSGHSHTRSVSGGPFADPSIPSRATDAGVVLDSGDQPQLPPDYHQVFNYRVANASTTASSDAGSVAGTSSRSAIISRPSPRKYPEKF